MIHEQVATRNRLEGETVCKYWIDTNKEHKPRDVIFILEKPKQVNKAMSPNKNNKDNGRTTADMAHSSQTTVTPDSISTVLDNSEKVKRPEYKTDLRKMAELARKYHAQLQEDRMDETHPERDTMVSEVLTNLQMALDLQQEAAMGQKIDDGPALIALTLLLNGMAAGIDRLPFELYKEISRRKQGRGEIRDR
ncbi:hypothetical protein AAF712_004831 [Marasmius tenuissimus]|uniref:Uncharacterized protein n=1 Tax=Marasmius tenuissimus TaxID=585030 RepID=A0ABR3A2R0_9AGAR